MTERITYIYGPIGRKDPRGVCGWIPPHPNVLRSLDEGVDISDAFMKRQRALGFFQSKRRLDLQRDRQDKTGTAQATNGCHEEIGSLLSGTGYAGSVGQ